MRTTKYAVDRTGFYTHLSSPLLDGWEKTELPKHIRNYVTDAPEKLDMGVRWKGSKLPSSMMAQVLGTIKQFPHRETGYVLYYRMSDKSWRIECPEQDGSGGHVDFTGKPTIDGYAEIGTIHTHPEMSAEWSSIDMHDQAGKFGLHMVIGTRDGFADKIKCTVFTNLGHYDQELWNVVESIDFHQTYEPRKDWLETLSKPKPQPLVKHGVFPGYPETGNIRNTMEDEIDGWQRHGGLYSNWLESYFGRDYMQQREHKREESPVRSSLWNPGLREQIEKAKETAFNKGYDEGYRKAMEAVVGNVMGSLVKLDDSTMPATVDAERVNIIRDFLDEHGVQTVDLSVKANASTTFQQLELLVARLVQWLKHQDVNENVQSATKGRKGKPKRLRTAIVGLFRKMMGKKG